MPKHHRDFPRGDLARREIVGLQRHNPLSSADRFAVGLAHHRQSRDSGNRDRRGSRADELLAQERRTIADRRTKWGRMDDVEDVIEWRERHENLQAFAYWPFPLLDRPRTIVLYDGSGSFFYNPAPTEMT